MRFRIDGILYDIISPPKRFQPVIISRIKIMAGLNIAEKRLPQDGRIRIKLAGKDIDIRVSTVPTAFGERVGHAPARPRGHAAAARGARAVGRQARDLVDKLIRQSHGIVLVTGPTGSGKTTTLYAALSQINTTDKNIITIEDPIEYQLHGVGQIQVNPKIELTFASGLRSILRQDPDVIMVGEIRDCGDGRDRDPGRAHRPPGVLDPAHQRLVRRHDPAARHGHRAVPGVVVGHRRHGAAPACAGCARRAGRPTSRRVEELRELGIAPQRLRGPHRLPAGPGCADCKQTGYRGRTGIHELLVVDDEMRGLVMKQRRRRRDPPRGDGHAG